MRRRAIAGSLALPLAGLALLLARPGLDVHWEHHPSHFWLVLGVALVNVALGLVLAEEARKRDDARVLLVGLAFLVSAGFLGLHALATPGVLLAGRSAGFVLATPVGLTLAAVFAVASAIEFGPEHSSALLARAGWIRGAVLALIVAWGTVSLASLPPLDGHPPERAGGPLVVLAGWAVVLYAIAAARYLTLARRRPAPLLVAIAASFALLAEAMIAVAYARNWHASWWEWHVLMAVAFALVAVVARHEYRIHPAAGTFSSLYLAHTLGRVDSRYAGAVEEIVGRGSDPDEVAARYGLGADEARMLARAGEQLGDIDRRLGAYLSPQLAGRLRAEPELGELGGTVRDVSVVFADLQGFTAFSEQASPTEVVEMLNEYWGVAVPIVLREHEGYIERFAGDAVMVVFNAATEQLDHPRRAAAAALALQEATERLAAERPGRPRFRAGVSTGPAVIGNVGTAEQKSFTAIGDTTNLASRLQTFAETGQVVISAATYSRLGPGAEAVPLPPLELKGKSDPVEAYLLVALR